MAVRKLSLQLMNVEHRLDTASWRRQWFQEAAGIGTGLAQDVRMKNRVLSVIVMCFFLPGCFIGEGRGVKKAFLLNGALVAAGTVAFAAGTAEGRKDKPGCGTGYAPCFDLASIGGITLGMSMVLGGLSGMFLTGINAVNAPKPQPMQFTPTNGHAEAEYLWEETGLIEKAVSPVSQSLHMGRE